jgi:hypothetical protein
VEEVSADKAYAGRPNFKAVDAVGGTFYPAFRTNTTGKVGPVRQGVPLFLPAPGRVPPPLPSAEHDREHVQHGEGEVRDAVRSKTDTAMRNEVLAKFVCHNRCCVIAGMYELGVNPTFGPDLGGEPNDGPRDIIRFPAR